MKQPEHKNQTIKNSPQSQFGSDPMSVGLNVLAETHNYNSWIYEQVAPFLGPKVVEVGSGIGNITQFLTSASRLDCIEPYEPYLKILEEKYSACENIHLHRKRIEEINSDDIPAGQADAVVCLNVLEHIEDDAAAIAAMKNLLAPGGRVVLVLPAMPAIYGSIDKNIGHYRRYSPAMVANLFARQGLECIENKYYNMLGSLGWFVKAKISKQPALPHKSSLMFDKMVPAIKKIEKVVRPPFGLSILAVGRKV